MIGKNLIAAAGNGISTGDAAEAIDFDGTNDYLSRLSDLVGNTNSQTFTFSCFVYPVGSNSNWLYLATDSLTNSRTFIRLSPSSGSFTLSVKGIDTSFNTCFEILNVSLIPADTWSSLIVSVNNALNTMWVSVNDVASSFSDAFSNTNAIDFTWDQHYVGVQSNNEYRGRMSNVFLDYTYRDMSITANRRLFVTADLKPADGQASLNPILYLPLNDPTAPGANAGTGGNFTLTGTVARSGRGPNQYNAPYSDLDGTADYLSRTTALAGIADGKTFTVNWCGNFDADAGNQVFTIATSTTARFYVLMGDGSGRVQVVAYNSSGTTILNGYSASSLLVSGRNYVITISVDLSNTSNRHCYVNGTSVAMTWSPYTNSDIDFAVASSPVTRVGVSSSTANYFNGKLGALWFNTSYIDLSVASNLAKFVTGTGIDAKPVDLGATGELPTGTSPLIYLPMYGNNAGKNYGTGGDFTVNSGPYTGARGPNEYWGNKADFDGTTGFLSKATTLGGVTSGKTMSGSFWINPDVVTGAPILLSMGTSAPATIVDISVDGSSRLQFRLYDLGTTKLSATVTSVTLGAGTSYFVQFCVDLSDSGKRFVYINGVAATVSYGFYVDASIPFSSINLAKFGQNFANSNNTYNGKLSEFYLTTDYIDFSQEANRLKFRDAFGNPVDLTQQIEAAAIPNPAIYMRFPPTSFGTNSGTGGDFTVNGTITDGGNL